jgi:PLP dependent protein
MSVKDNLIAFNKELPSKVTLVAVSKTKPIEAIQEAYDAGQRNFGENKVQEMVDKWEKLPKDINWHLIGHLQTNKVKYIARFVHLIHSVDSLKLLQEINKQALKNNRIIDCLLQIYIAKEETKFGLDLSEAENLIDISKELKNIRIVGLMGMATNTEDEKVIRFEFAYLKTFFNKLSILNTQYSILSMGMTSDYKIAIEEGSNMIRVGSAIFGERNYV